MIDAQKLHSLVGKLHPMKSGKDLIRLGPKTDSRYLIPDDLVGIKACFSPGVGYVSGFEKDCVEMGMNVFLADKSVDGSAQEDELFSFIKKFIGNKTNDDFITLNNWVAASNQSSSSDLML
jgi:hypothetical protein